MAAPAFAPMVLSQHSLVDSRSASRVPRKVDPRSGSLSSFRSVVVCLDGSEFGRGVLTHARAISRAFDAKLSLLRVLESERGSGTTSVPADPLDWGIRQREARADLERVAAEFGEKGSPIRSDVILGRPAEQICHWVESHSVDLTVLCSHGTSGLTEWDLASTARKLIDRIPGSLLLVPASSAAEARPADYRKILVPLDGSARAESVVPVALRIAAVQNAEVEFVHVVAAPEILRLGIPDAEGIELESRVIEHNLRTATTYLDRLRARLGRAGAKVKTRVVSDRNVQARLNDLIREQDADLVVMSAHGATGEVETSCGSVTEYALAHASVPMLVIRERDQASSQRPRDRSPRARSTRDGEEPAAS